MVDGLCRSCPMSVPDLDDLTVVYGSIDGAEARLPYSVFPPLLPRPCLRKGQRRIFIRFCFEESEVEIAVRGLVNSDRPGRFSLRAVSFRRSVTAK
jgi:hypothetical protein